MCDGEADDVDSICELYAAEAHRSAPLRTTISVNLREELRGAGTERAVSSRARRHGGLRYVRRRRSDSHPNRPSRRCLRSPSSSNPPNRLVGDSDILTTRNFYTQTKRPQRDSNPCYSLERAVSWAGLDDGDRGRPLYSEARGWATLCDALADWPSPGVERGAAQPISTSTAVMLSRPPRRLASLMKRSTLLCPPLLATLEISSARR